MKIDKKLINHFLSNSCDAKECKEIASYFEKNEQALDHITLFEDIGHDELIYTSLADKKRAYSNLPFVKKHNRFIYLKVAAAAVLISVFSYLLWIFAFTDQTTLSRSDAPDYVISNDGTTYKLVTLPDSSTLLLWPKARVSYQADFLKNRLINQLEGQVKYTVTPDKVRPFRTRYENVETKVLGTIFTISEHADGRLSIKLSEGKIQVQDTKGRMEPVILDQSGGILIDRHTLAYEHTKQETADFKEVWKKESRIAKHMVRQGISEWTNDYITLKGIDNADLIDLIERLYGVQIILKDESILAGNFTGSVLYHEDLNILLQSFCEMNGCTYRMDSDIIHLE